MFKRLIINVKTREEYKLKLIPSDIYKHEFKKAFRGLDQADVEDFIDQVAEEYEMLFNENNTLKQQVEAVEERLRQVGNPEIMNEMIQKAKDRINKEISDAEAEAETIINEAKKEAEEESQRIIQEARDKVKDSRSQINDSQSPIDIIDKAFLNSCL